MNKEPFISFIISTYKPRKDLFKRLIDSILNTGLKTEDYEIIVANDSPEEEIYDIEMQDVLSGVQNINIIYFKNETNLGTVESQRRAVERASGYYIMYGDQDDYFVKDSLANIKSIEEYDVIQLGYKHIEADTGYYIPGEAGIEDIDVPTIVDPDCIYDAIFREYNDITCNFIHGCWAMLFKRKILLETYADIPHVYCCNTDEHLLLHVYALKAKSYANFHKEYDVYRYDRTVDSITHLMDKITIQKIKVLCSSKEVYPILKEFPHIKNDKQLLSNLTWKYKYCTPKFIANIIAINKNNLKRQLIPRAKQIFIESFGKQIFDECSDIWRYISED